MTDAHIPLWDATRCRWPPGSRGASLHEDRGEAGFRDLARQFRVYDVGDQDGIADWIRAEFPGMNYLLARPPAGRDKREATYRGMYLTGDESLTSRSWVERNVLSSGALGALTMLPMPVSPPLARFTWLVALIVTGASG